MTFLEIRSYALKKYRRLWVDSSVSAFSVVAAICFVPSAFYMDDAYTLIIGFIVSAMLLILARELRFVGIYPAIIMDWLVDANNESRLDIINSACQERQPAR